MDSHKRTPRKEHPATPEVAAAAKKQPIKVIRADDVSVSIFEHQRETSGVKRVNYSCSFQRSYKDSAGEWKRTQWFGLDDLGKLVSVAQQASEYLHSLNEPGAEPRK